MQKGDSWVCVFGCVVKKVMMNCREEGVQGVFFLVINVVIVGVGRGEEGRNSLWKKCRPINLGG